MIASLSEAPLLAPDLPALWPGMLVRSARQAQHLPFGSRSALYFYFARNAIWQAVKLLGLEGYEVLAPAYHHGVEIEALLAAGATVRFYRIGPRWDVDLDDLASKIGDRTRALYLTHYAGFPGPAREMLALCRHHGLRLIEDCALSLLSSDGRHRLGSYGDVSIFCLYKTLPVPNGGAMVFNASVPRSPVPFMSPSWGSTTGHLLSSMLQGIELRLGKPGALARKLIRALGRSAANASGVERVATGTRHFDPRHVNLGISGLSHRIAMRQDLDEIVRTRRRNYQLLAAELATCSTPLHPKLPHGVCPLFYPLIVENKDEVLSRLRSRGVQAVDFWRFSHPACALESFPDVARLRQTVVEIPCHQDLSPGRIRKVAAVVRAAVSDKAS
jgi:dTDP-4-amino-4,6-dideoxygalactose transaminase